MEYQVSEQVRRKFDALTKNEKVIKALDFMEKDQDAIIIAVNNDENPAELYVPVPLQADEFVNLESKEVLRMENGRIRVQLPAGGSALLVPVRR